MVQIHHYYQLQIKILKIIKIIFLIKLMVVKYYLEVKLNKHNIKYHKTMELINQQQFMFHMKN